MAFVQDSMNINLLISSGGLEMIGGDITEINNVRVSHFVYRNASAIVSLFVCRGCDMAVPDGAVANGQGQHVHQCAGCMLCFGSCGKARLVAAESSGEVDLGRFLEGHQEILASTF